MVPPTRLLSWHQNPPEEKRKPAREEEEEEEEEEDAEADKEEEERPRVDRGQISIWRERGDQT